jgi:hypothetical protein
MCGIGGSSLEKKCKQTLDGMENNETWCGKKQVGATWYKLCTWKCWKQPWKDW